MSWQTALANATSNPLPFITEVLQVEPEPWQRAAWEQLAKHDRLSIRSGHGVGKTFWVSATALWYLLTRRDVKIPIAANTQDQLRDTIWPELRRLRSQLPKELQEVVDVRAERVTVKSAPDNFITGRTVNESNPEGLQGFHATHLMFLIDEASGLPDIAFELARGALSTPGAKQVLTGNPTRLDGYFYRTHHSLRQNWSTLRVNSEDVPRATGHIDDIIADYGRESNQYRVRVLGEFPRQDDETLFGLDLVEGAIGREVQRWQRSPVWGVDIARFGDDRSALSKRWGNVVSEPVKFWHGNDLMQSCGKIKREYDMTPEGEKPGAINIDVIGVGSGVVDRLKEMGLPVRGINVGERPYDDSGKYMRLGDELWFSAHKWFKGLDVSTVKDELLISELTARRYTLESSGKLRMEPKDQMKKRGLRSPDVADAFVLTFAGGDYVGAHGRQQTAVMDYDVFGDNRRPQTAGMDYEAI